MAAADQKKTLSKFETQILALIWEKVRPQVEAAIEAAKVRLRLSVGEEDLGKISKLAARLDRFAAEGWGPMSPKVTKLMAGASALLALAGLYKYAVPAVKKTASTKG